LKGRKLKYQRFDAEDVAEALRYEIEARQAKLRAEQITLSNELIGPYKATWDFWQALFERRDVKVLADFEVGDEFQAALEYSIRVLETSPGWASRPERDGLLVQYRRRRIERASREAAIGEPHHADPVQKGRPRSDAPELLKEILTALEDYAAETCQIFDRDAMPGPRGEGCDDEGSFHWLCAKLRPHAFMKSRSTFERQRNGVCKLGPWARPTDFYREALPHIAPKLGVKLNVSRLPSRATKAA